MRNWKELGEVPDSDDEDFDSYESPNDNVADGTEPALPTQVPARAHVDDVWDVPASSGEPDLAASPHQNGRVKSAPEELGSPPSSPLSPPPDIDDDLDDFDELGALPAAPLRTNNAELQQPSTAPAADKVTVTFEDDEISTSRVTIATPPGHRNIQTTALEPGICSVALSTSQHRKNALEVVLPARRVNSQGPDPDLMQASIRAERSLRPRKPIQQHPYLLESVQYAHVMKSHGVKPIRVVLEASEAGTRQDQEDSQDKEFEADDESQARTTSGPVDGMGESQPVLLDDTENEADIPVPSPSPFRRSSPRHLVQASSQRTDEDMTDNTSVVDEELPSIEELVRRQASKPRSKVLKRQRSSKLVPLNKRIRSLATSPIDVSSPLILSFEDIWSLPMSSPDDGQPHDPSQDLGNTPRSPLRPRLATPVSLHRGLRHDTPSATPSMPIIDLTEQVDEGESSGAESASAISNSESVEEEVVRRTVKRIRGVLPASWLRLDKQKEPKSTQMPERSRHTSPDRTLPRRGVAQPKAPGSNSKTSAAPFAFSDDETDDNDITTSRPEGPRSEPHLYSRRSVSQDMSPMAIWSDHDDAGSVVEEDHIDRMFTGPSRKRTSTGASSTSKRRKTTQPKITQAVGGYTNKVSTTDKTASTTETKRRNAGASKSSRRKRQTRRPATPPLLSILDVVEPQAPAFLKIAARTAKRRPNLGKQSPSNKHISLGSRKDNVDARSVLQDWKSGRIRPRVMKPQCKNTGGRESFRSLSANQVSSPLLTRGSELVRHNSTSKTVGVVRGGGGENGRKDRQEGRKPTSGARVQSWSVRQAQLETEQDDPQTGAGFVARKRILDALYRSSRREKSNHSVDMDQFWDPAPSFPSVDEPQLVCPAAEERSAPTPQRRNNTKSRFRKRFVPKPVDLDAAHFVHANDPILVEDDILPIREPEERRHEGKLGGLGPYGIKYTHHFEIFPLDHGVFFHSTTIMGSGWVKKIADASYPESTRQVRPRTSFTMDGKPLRWGSWDDTTSSELGILVDWIAEQLLSLGDIPRAEPQPKPGDAAAFLLGYIVDSISFPDEDSLGSFVSRSVEVFGGFIARIHGSPRLLSGSKKATKESLEVLTFVTLISAAIHHLSSSVRNLRFQVEDLLTKTAKLCIQNLLSYGLDDLRTLYGYLQHLSARERGVRSDNVAANSWAVLIRVMENARIPRSSFWDMTQAVMLESKNVASESDARFLESLWRDMFTLLPLTEVDDFGVVKTGMRYTAPVEGWTLAQRLLKRVFQLYTANVRQPPSFNEYCRALAARCHYLVQQWGWRKCSGIVGTWFDFFGSHNLSHLRNEEVFKSPRFLDELHLSPSLALDPEDRCFHIFLKMLALVIQRLNKLGLVNDIRNLVARTLPNHNRQYLKEDTVHQRDLAALRNHHDLLCTLFWAAPPDLRPAVRLLEKLVPPATSHKEALLINLRAWNQLARFVVASEEDHAGFKPLQSWQNNIFHQILHQYRTAAKDIKDQVDAMTGPAVSKEIIDSMVKKNRAVAMDVLFIAGQGSFEVLKLARALGTAIYTLNVHQLQQIFSLDFVSQNFDWTVVKMAVDMLEHYISRVEKAAEEQYSSEAPDSKDLADAILLLDHSIADKFYKMGRAMMSLPRSAIGFPRGQHLCIERTVTLSARIACRFLDFGLTGIRTSAFFASDKYGLFPDMPLSLGSPYRRYLPLFLATFVKNNFYDFKDAKASLFQLWMVAIVKPSGCLGYENVLADVLKHRRRFGLERVALLPGAMPNYNSNLDMFACGMHHLRDELRKADSVAGKLLRRDYAVVLNSVMQRMKEDLKALRGEPLEHKSYMKFVQQIIVHIKSYGVNICPVDPFFTQPGEDFTPPMGDPQLHSAGIMGYGIRLGEGDTTVYATLFHYLYQNFKVALVNGKLDEECRILEKAMDNEHVFSFVLTKVLPATIWATSKVHEAWPLLDVYTGALRKLLTRSILSKEVGEQSMKDVTALMDYILIWMRTFLKENSTSMTRRQLHVLVQLVDLATLVRPSLVAHLGSDIYIDEKHREAERSLSSFTHFATRAATGLDRWDGRQVTGLEGTLAIDMPYLFDGVPDLNDGPFFGSGRELSPQVDSFAHTIVNDVSKNWVVHDTLASINTPGRGPQGMTSTSTQSGQGTRYERFEHKALANRLKDLLMDWIPPATDRRGRKKRLALGDDDLLF